MPRRQLIRKLGRQLADCLPFPNAHNRTEAKDYESYRQHAIVRLMHFGLSSVRAHCLVDECIAVAENRLHGRLDIAA